MKETGLLFKGVSTEHRDRLNAINQKRFLIEEKILFLYIIPCPDIQPEVFPPSSKDFPNSRVQLGKMFPRLSALYYLNQFPPEHYLQWRHL